MQFNEDLIRRPDESWFEAGRRWMMATGGRFPDGIRLAVLNGLLLLAALIAGSVIGLIVDLLQRLIPIPDLLPVMLVALAGIGVGVMLWYRFGAAHEHGSRMRAQRADPSLVGVIGSAPFVVVAGMIAIGALVQIFVSSITLDGGGLGSGLLRLLWAGLFAGLAVAVVAVVRAGARS